MAGDEVELLRPGDDTPPRSSTTRSLCWSHAMMITASAFAAFVACTVDLVGQRGVSGLDQLLCAVVLRVPCLLLASCWALVKGTPQATGASQGMLVFQGALGGMTVIFYHTALVGVQLASATTIIYSEAIWVPVCAAFFVGEAFRRYDCVACIVATAGVAFIAGGGQVSVLAVLAAVGDVVSFSCLLLVTRVYLPDVNLWIAQTWQIILAGLLYFIFAIPYRCVREGCGESFAIVSQLLGYGDHSMEPSTMVLIIFGNAIQIVQIILTQGAIQSAAANELPQVMLWIYLIPVLSGLLGSLVAHEIPSKGDAVGIIFIASAIAGHRWLSSREPSANPAWLQHLYVQLFAKSDRGP